jgi:hypothetical protein
VPIWSVWLVFEDVDEEVDDIDAAERNSNKGDDLHGDHSRCGHIFKGKHRVNGCLGDRVCH